MCLSPSKQQQQQQQSQFLLLSHIIQSGLFLNELSVGDVHDVIFFFKTCFVAKDRSKFVNSTR